MSEQKVKRRGRPPLDPADRKDGNLTFRTRGDLRQRLAEEAKKNGRTISEEVEWRLERSLAGLSGEDSEPSLFSEAICGMLGTGADLSEAVELGMAWNRVKTRVFIANNGIGDWYKTEENINLAKEFFESRIKDLFQIFAARRSKAEK